MPTEEVLIYIGIYLYAAIPFEKWIYTLLKKAKKVEARLQKEKDTLFCSKMPWVWVISKSLTVSKGVLPFWVIEQFVYKTIDLFWVLPLLILLGHNWSCFLKSNLVQPPHWLNSTNGT